jgi:hypothetical protein
MLRIDRVTAQMDVLPSSGANAGGSTGSLDAAAVLADPQARERIRELVRETLCDHLRKLERGGLV